MSRITELLRYVEKYDSALADDLRDEFRILSDRRAFGLNFERHVPETVELPHRAVRRGDKVRFRAPRGESEKGLDKRLWLVTRVTGKGSEREAALVEWTTSQEPEETTRSVSDLVVVAEFRDPIYPGLRSTGRVERGGDKPYHLVINGENYHALDALLFAYESKVDCIYIDPPYNTRDKDWKYNNDYVDSDDAYKHSKWLAMMERRLKLAKKLLNPDDSVLIVTIDEHEVHRLALLLEQTFPAARKQMVTSVINPFGVARDGFNRVEEYLVVVRFGAGSMKPWASNMLNGEASDDNTTYWFSFMRAGSNSTRTRSPGCFYPIFVTEDGAFHSVGDALPAGQSPETVTPPDGCLAIWPIKQRGGEAVWQGDPDTARYLFANGYARIGEYNPSIRRRSVTYLRKGTIQRIDDGDLELGEDGTIKEVTFADPSPKSVWNMPSHNATSHGTKLLSKFLPDRKFPFPKSLYAVEDALRFFVADKPNAVILDFFAGSGTTGHAVMRLNRQDGGRRQSILVTNNEISADEEKRLRKAGHRRGDPEWEALGICEHITKPRIRAAITGRTPDGTPIEGDYRFTDEFPMADGFEENAEFFELTYEDPERVRLDMAFSAVAPLLWMRAGCQGPRIDVPSDTYELTDFYGVLFNVDAANEFLAEAAKRPDLRVVYVVTDEEKQYQLVAGRLPAEVEVVQLYEAYLTTFEINSGRDLT